MSSNVKSPLGWPAKPYKGFNYFRREDQLLLSGRDDEVTACAFLFAHPDTRVLLLHGVTGCGKSSFLRAGLIPALEENAGFFFLKTPGTDDEALFIRCTEAPIDQIARQVFSFDSKPFPSESPPGMRQLDLPSALSGLGWEAFLDSAREQNGSLLECLSKIAERLPRTLVLIVDQAEEVLTHSPGEENFLNRARFFEFLRDFQQIETRARIIVTLRTEYFGRFIDAIQISYQSRDELKQFLLSELSGTALVEAALLPTSREQFRSFDPPHSVYGFDFEMGLPETIVKDILSARYSGPALPVLQLVCLGLYEDAKLEHRSLIDREAYRSKGGWEGQILKHLGGAVRAMFGRDPDATSIFRSDLEKLQAFLGSFYVMQDDGTVVARAREMTWVETQLGTLDLHVAPRDVIESLASP